jgi:hypothetical protein
MRLLIFIYLLPGFEINIYLLQGTTDELDVVDGCRTREVGGAAADRLQRLQGHGPAGTYLGPML